MSSLSNFVSDPLDDLPPPSRKRKPLSQSQLDDFLEAAEERPALTEVVGRRGKAELLGNSGRMKFLTIMQRKYPLRMRRLVKDLEWLRKNASKNGLDPAEIRYML
jgi:hypothetical protein